MVVSLYLQSSQASVSQTSKALRKSQTENKELEALVKQLRSELDQTRISYDKELKHASNLNEQVC